MSLIRLKTHIHRSSLGMSKTIEFPPLLPDGLHARTMDQINEECVDAFPDSESRPDLIGGLRIVLETLRSVGIQGTLWIDGSFVTEKPNPNDIDVLLYIPNGEELLEMAKSELEDFRDRCMHEHRCHIFFTSDEARRDGYWRNQFGQSRDGEPKGIITMPVNGGGA